MSGSSSLGAKHPQGASELRRETVLTRIGSRVLLALVLILAPALPLGAQSTSDPERAGGAAAPSTDLLLAECGSGVETLSYFEFSKTVPLNSMATSANWIASCNLIGHRDHLGLFARGTLTPAALYTRERWYSHGSLVQQDDLAYRLDRSVAGAGYVFPSGIDAYLGFWYAEGDQTRKNFDSAARVRPLPFSVERPESRGIVLGLQGLYLQNRQRTIGRFYGDLIIPFDARVRNSAVPGASLHSWGIGVEGGATYGRTFGTGSDKTFVTFQVNVLGLYYNDQVRNDIGVEWPHNLTIGASALVNFGGGRFSILER